MDEETAFLRAIHDRPEDDLPRLIYADYLDERGQADRAEFIRVGCQRARLSNGDPRHRRLMERELELLAEHQDEWERPYAAAFTVRFDRGFASALEIEASQFLADYRSFMTLCPAASIRLRNAWEELDRLAKLPEEIGIRELDLSGNGLHDADLDRLVPAGWIGRLDSLKLNNNRLSAASAQRLARLANLANLRVIELSGNAIGCQGAAALAESRFLDEVRVLALRSAGIRSSGAAALAEGAGLPGLETLDLRGNEIGANGVRALLFGPNCSRWKRLILRGEDLLADQREQLRAHLGAVLDILS